MMYSFYLIVVSILLLVFIGRIIYKKGKLYQFICNKIEALFNEKFKKTKIGIWLLSILTKPKVLLFTFWFLFLIILIGFNHLFVKSNYKEVIVPATSDFLNVLRTGNFSVLYNKYGNNCDSVNLSKQLLRIKNEYGQILEFKPSGSTSSGTVGSNSIIGYFCYYYIKFSKKNTWVRVSFGMEIDKSKNMPNSIINSLDFLDNSNIYMRFICLKH